jgi:hypothetical protein
LDVSSFHSEQLQNIKGLIASKIEHGNGIVFYGGADLAFQSELEI